MMLKTNLFLKCKHLPGNYTTWKRVYNVSAIEISYRTFYNSVANTVSTIYWYKKPRDTRKKQVENPWSKNAGKEWDKKLSKKKTPLFFSAFTVFMQVDTLSCFKDIDQEPGIFTQEVSHSGITVFPQISSHWNTEVLRCFWAQLIPLPKRLWIYFYHQVVSKKFNSWGMGGVQLLELYFIRAQNCGNGLMV